MRTRLARLLTRLRARLLTRWSPGAWLVRGAVVLLPLLALVVSLPAGAHVWPTFWVVVAATGVGAALMPDSPALLVTFLLLLYWWGTQVDHPLSGWVLVAALAMVAAQVAGAVGELGPPAMELDPRLVRLWAPRAALVLVAAPLAWGVARVVDGAPEQPGVWVAGATGSLVGLLLVFLVLRLRAE